MMDHAKLFCCFRFTESKIEILNDIRPVTQEYEKLINEFVNRKEYEP